MDYLENILEAIAVLFVVVGPVDNSVVFATLSSDYPPKRRRRVACKSILVAGGMLSAFALVGDDVLRLMGIQLASLEVAGGILLLLMGIKMVSASDASEIAPSGEGSDISVFPMAMPMIAGPDAIVAVVLLMGKYDGHWGMELSVLGVLGGMLLVTLVAMLFAGRISRLLGPSGQDIFTRVLGVLLTAMACEFILEGIAHSSFITALVQQSS